MVGNECNPSGIGKLWWARGSEGTVQKKALMNKLVFVSLTMIIDCKIYKKWR